VPALLQLGDRADAGDAGARAAEARFRDELIALARESSEIAMRELRRGLYDLDAFTRAEDPPAEGPARPYKAKR
jgi:hypothetical protein